MAMLLTFLVGIFIARSQRVRELTASLPKHNIQNMHKIAIPRLGGVGIICGLLLAIVLNTGEVRREILMLIFGASPLFISGFWDDVTQKITPKVRLLLGFIAGLFYVALTGNYVQGIDFPVIKEILQFKPIAIVVTAFALSGLAHGMNIIDGFNGLASGSAILMYLGIAFIARDVGNVTIFQLALIHASIVFGFFVLNFPRALLFMGDGGIYYVGFSLAALIIMLINQHPNISPWALVLIIVYPIIEAFFSIVRKAWTRGHSPMKADDIHLHHLLYRIILKLKLPRVGLQFANAATSLVLLGYPLLCIICAVMSYRNSFVSVICFLSLSLAYILSYGVFTYIVIRLYKK